MRSSLPLLTAVAVTLLATATALAAKPDAKRFGWHTEYAPAKAEARRTGKPMLLVFRCEP